MKLINKDILRIAITGPESTGKSTLSEQLANHYNTVWVKEYARSFIDQLKRPYEQKDLLEIARGQLQDEDQISEKANRLLFCDTELLVIKIWSSYKYGTVDPFISTELKNRKYDLYLLTNIDLTWKEDDQREHPEKRAYFFELFENELTAMGANYHIITGNNQGRLKNSIQVIDNFLNQIHQ